MKKKRKALLLSIGYGQGHHSAAQALAEALRHRGWHVSITDACAEAQPTLFRLTQLFYRFCIRSAPWLWGILYRMIDTADWARLIHAPFLSRSTAWLRRHLISEKPDLVVCTYPLYAYMLDAFCREGLPCPPYAIVVTDALHISRPWVQSQAPLICLPDEHSLSAVQASYGLKDEQVCASGFPVREAFCPEKERRAPGERGEGLHIVYGAYAPIERVKADVERITHDYPAAHITLLAEERESRLHSLLQLPNVQLCGEGQRTADLLRKAHLYIGKAGAASMFEAYAAETPMLVNYSLPGQEQGNLQLLLRDGAGAYVESAEELSRTLRHLFKNSAAGWKRMCQAMRQAQRTGGAERTVDLLERRFFS